MDFDTKVGLELQIHFWTDLLMHLYIEIDTQMALHMHRHMHMHMHRHMHMHMYRHMHMHMHMHVHMCMHMHMHLHAHMHMHVHMPGAPVALLERFAYSFIWNTIKKWTQSSSGSFGKMCVQFYIENDRVNENTNKTNRKQMVSLKKAIKQTQNQ
jgi:hypothetical protein